MGQTVTLRIWESLSILLAALVTGVFWGPWIALSRSIATFPPEIFLPITRRMSKNLAPVMTALMPAALLSMGPVLFLTYDRQPTAFYLTLAGLALFALSLLTTIFIEVPLVKQFEIWTTTTIPTDWQQLRDRWSAFHLVRITASVAGLTFLVIGAVFF